MHSKFFYQSKKSESHRQVSKFKQQLESESDEESDFASWRSCSLSSEDIQSPISDNLRGKEIFTREVTFQKESQDEIETGQSFLKCPILAKKYQLTDVLLTAFVKKLSYKVFKNEREIYLFKDGSFAYFEHP